MLDYETALAVYRYESWAEAAYATFQSPSSVSKRVSKLEKELGVQIFERAGRGSGTVLTSMGSIAMPYIRQIVDSFTSISAQADELRCSMQANLRVGYQLLAGSIGAAEMLACFRAENPDISLAHTMRSKDDLIELLRIGDIDCAFLFAFDGDMNRGLMELMSESGIAFLPYLKCGTLWVGVRHDHPIAQKDSVTMEELEGETLIVNSVTGGSSLLRLLGNKGERGDGQMQFRVRPIDYVNRQVVTDYIVSGKGILPTVCMSPMDARDKVSYVRVSDVDPRASASFLYPKEGASKAVKLLLDFVKEFAEGRRRFEYQ